MVSVAAMASAQTMTMRGFTAGGGTTENSYGVFGQPFGDIVDDGTNELSVGMAQMQLVRDTVYAVINYDADYTENGFALGSSQTPPTPQTISHKDSLYLVNGAEYNYDLLRTLYLIVCPQSVVDAGSASITYGTVAVSGYCWTRENLRNPNGEPMQYVSEQYPIVDYTKYGYLYTWENALGGVMPQGGDSIQGLCPNASDPTNPEVLYWDWYIPNEAEETALRSHDAASLRSLEGWVNGSVNTNSTGFTEYPAGEYSATYARFQNMGAYADFWTTMRSGENSVISLQTNYFCDVPMRVERKTSDGLSVRCVMKNKWHELDK
jgi:uncharacterized protein (TIGR02145 family)